MTRRARLEAALEAAHAWHSALPEVTRFCEWPDDLAWNPDLTGPGCAKGHVLDTPGKPSAASAPLLRALQSIARDVEWRTTYTAEEVGQHFLDTFGWFELAGPLGHFTTQKTRITVGVWGPGLHYPRHDHLAEELYTVVSGDAVFMSDGDPDARLVAGGTRLHASHQPHAMQTHSSPVVTLVFWRGAGLADPPRMTT